MPPRSPQQDPEYLAVHAEAEAPTPVKLQQVGHGLEWAGAVGGDLHREAGSWVYLFLFILTPSPSFPPCIFM